MTAPRLAIGLMSGTSMDGIDAAVLSLDDKARPRQGPALSSPYDDGTRARLRGILGGKGGEGEIAAVGELLTQAHAALVRELLQSNGLGAGEISVIGFHGHTILHRPERRQTWQIGDGALLAALTGIDVVDDFRSADVAAGGQGAPFAPLYHRALAEEFAKPLSVLNIGGVANVTWIGAGSELLAFDTGPGNALIDDWVRRHGLGERDTDGRLAETGHIDEASLVEMLANDYFDLVPPKSLDRDDFKIPEAANWSAADGAATLAAFSARAVAMAQELLPAPPERWLVCGGGRHNPFLMGQLANVLETPVQPVEAVGWRGDFLEAEAFAYLALRHLDGLPLSLPGTTGVPQPMTGGRLNRSPA